ncbi:MAG: M67 family metallopeptidase [Rhodospirillales bacterium]|nr:M67 family metallopeptidase [Rhodospirillales bacterium]
MIYLPSGALRQIASAAAAAYPQECCGLLIGRAPDGERGDVFVDEIMATANTAPPPRTRAFEIDPAALFAAHRRLRESRWSIVGHYHSHPDGPAAPSPRDAERVFDPRLIWVIAAVACGCAGTIGAFRWDADARQFIAIALAEMAAPPGLGAAATSALSAP